MGERIVRFRSRTSSRFFEGEKAQVVIQVVEHMLPLLLR